MDGRDCGTAVFPDAHLKIFLKADALTRARRRLAELQQQHAQTGAVHGLPLPTLERLCGEIQRRDDADIGRAISPLRKADDAVEIDGTELSREQQVEAIVRLAEEVVRRFK